MAQIIPSEPALAAKPADSLRGRILLGITLAEAVVATAFIGLRYYAYIRNKSTRGGQSVYYAIGAWMISITSQAFLVPAVVYGAGKHQTTLLDEDHFWRVLEWDYLGIMTSILSIGFGKLAVVAFLVQVLHQTTYTSQKKFLWVLGYANVVMNTGCCLQIIFSCWPPGARWSPPGNGKCSPLAADAIVAQVTGGINGVTDIILALFPILVFWHLQLATKKKVGLCILLGGGLVAAAVTVGKIVRLSVLYGNEDAIYQLDDILILNWTEMWVTLIMQSVAPLWPFLKKLQCPFRMMKDLFYSHRITQLNPAADYYGLRSNNEVVFEAYTSFEVDKDTPCAFDLKHQPDDFGYMQVEVTVTEERITPELIALSHAYYDKMGARGDTTRNRINASRTSPVMLDSLMLPEDTPIRDEEAEDNKEEEDNNNKMVGTPGRRTSSRLSKRLSAIGNFRKSFDALQLEGTSPWDLEEQMEE